ncbi:SIS domain-containing protein [soil metagenome]
MAITAMARETAEAPEAVARLLARNGPAFAEIARMVRDRRPSHVVTSARGSSDNAASYFKYLCEIMLGLPCCSIGASVVSIYGARLHLRDTILVTVSQSGMGPDLLSFQAEAKRGGIPAIAVTNDETSPLAREADLCLPLCAGPELSVAATKTFITSAVAGAAIIAACAGDSAFTKAVDALPECLSRALAVTWPHAEEAIATSYSLYVLGRGPSLPIAMEAALKLKETSGIHAEAYSAAEVRHGPMELVREGFPVLVLAPDDAARETSDVTVAALREAGAAVFSTGTGGLDSAATAHPFLDPVSMITTFYAAAERIARARGRDPDRPRLLRKVTRTR